MPTHIQCVDEHEATGQLSQVYQRWLADNPGRNQIPGILQCFSQRPDFLSDVIEMSKRIHFSDGYLDRRTKERIATYVSALNQCRY